MRLIDSDAITYHEEWKEEWLRNSGYYHQVAWKEEIDKLPTIEAEPVQHGHWERAVSWLIPTCSVCGENAIGIHAFDCKLTDYCPHCGAKMDEVE